MTSLKRTLTEGPQIRKSGGIQNFEEVRKADSFILEETPEMEMSFVEAAGPNILNWSACKGKAS
jgi:hypothetical protein